jgi:hypothetical protein
MRVYIIVDDTVDRVIYKEILLMLNSISGSIQFFGEKENDGEEEFKRLSSQREIFVKNREIINNFIDKYNEISKNLFPMHSKLLPEGNSFNNLKISKNFKKTYNKLLLKDLKNIEIICPRCNNPIQIINLVTDKFQQYLEIDTKCVCANCSAIINPRKYITRYHSFDYIFEKCNSYRISNNIVDQDFVILLTEKYNQYNWFSSLDLNLMTNGYINTRDWDNYIDSDTVSPIVYQIVSLFLQKHIYKNFKNFKKYRHITPIGCINDMCINKNEVILKLRTADICPKCLKILNENLPYTVIQHALIILETLRKKMLFSQKFIQSKPLSRLIIDKNKNIFLSDFDNLQIKLDALTTTLYILYLNHPEGIEHSSICDYKNEMYSIYSKISNRGDVQDMKKSIEKLSNVNSNRASEVINAIKEEFIKSIGSDLAKNYYIKGARGKAKKIDIDRKLVEFLV